MDDRRLAELIELYLDNELSGDDAAEFRAHLEANSQSVATVLEATKGHVLCRSALRPSDPQVLAQRAHQLLATLPTERRQEAAKQVMRRINKRRSIHFWGRWSAVAAAALLIIAMKPWNWQTAINAERDVPTDGTSPHIIAMSGLVTDANGNGFVIGQPLPDRVTIHTSDNASATMLWHDGTSVTIDKSSVCEQYSAVDQRLRLDRGSITVRAAHRKEANALVISTVDSTTKVVGTQFTLSVDNGRSILHVKEGIVEFKRTSDGKISLVGAGERVSVGYVPPPPICMSSEHVEAVRAAIARGRSPWAQTYNAIEYYAPIWVKEPIQTPEKMTIYSWSNEREKHSVSRRIYGAAAQKSLGLALAARLGDNVGYAERAAEIIRAWIRVPVDGSDVDYVVLDTATVFIQAADLIRRTGIWTNADDVAMEAFISNEIESRIPNMESQSRPRARWRAVTARMLIAGWRGDIHSVRSAMQLLVSDCQKIIAQETLQKIRNEGEGTLLHTMNQAMMAADVARTAGVVIEPPANYQMALTWILEELDQGVNASRRHLEIDPVIYGVPGWRLPITQPLAAGPSPINRVAFSWYFPTMIGLDPRLVP